MVLEPIGLYRSRQVHPFDAARQFREDRSHLGEIILDPGRGFEQALVGLEGFDRIWLLFQFHHNPHWHPMVRPPRGSARKIGVFATRAPYRPNALGLSCVRLESVEDRRILVRGGDLLDGTPVFDIKPYLPEADSFPDAKIGWLEGVEESRFQIRFSEASRHELRWLRQEGLETLQDFIEQQLEFEPFDSDRKRVKSSGAGWVLAYRTWRIEFQSPEPRTIRVERIFSGYSDQDLSNPEDPWADKALHRRFRETFRPGT